jgi:pyrroloquinoline quinone biosynthesis protein B
MKVLVLGSAGSGTYARRAGSRAAGGAAPVRTRSALAISSDGRRWLLVNASPDIGTQMRMHPALCPSMDSHADADAMRPVVLTSAGIDAAVGLLSLRDGPPIDLYATPSVFEDLTSGLPLLTVLQHYCGVRWHLLGIAGEQRSFVFGIEALAPLVFEALALPGLAPPYSNHRNDPIPGDHIALRIRNPQTRRSLVYAPELAGATGDAIESLQDADCVLLDGSTWPARMTRRHTTPTLPELLERSRASRKVLLHLRAGDPLLDERGRERQRLQARGFEVGYDGMEIDL